MRGIKTRRTRRKRRRRRTYQKLFVNAEHLLRLDDVCDVVGYFKRVFDAEALVLRPAVNFGLTGERGEGFEGRSRERER